MGESTREPVVRLAGDRVVLDVDLDVGFGPSTVGRDVVNVVVSPARAVEILDGLRDVLPQLREAVAEQERAAAAARAQGALGRAVELLKDPLLADWRNITMGYDAGQYDPATGWSDGRGDYVQVMFYGAEKAGELERYAAQAGAEVVRRSVPHADLLDVWVGSGELGWVNLHSQLAYYPDGRPAPTAEGQPDALTAAIEEVAAVAREQDAGVESDG